MSDVLIWFPCGSLTGSFHHGEEEEQPNQVFFQPFFQVSVITFRVRTRTSAESGQISL